MTGASGLAAVQARIAQIEARFAVQRPPTRSVAVPAGGGTDFASALAGAQAAYGSAAAAPVTGEQVVGAAMKYLGVPYRWGGTDPETGLDCSGFVQQAYEDLGITLPRVSRDQAKAGRAVADLASARPGDLVAFNTPVDHIGIYIGGGKMVVAPRTGDVVKVQDVPTHNITAIRRVLPEGGDLAAGALVGRATSSASAPLGASPYSALFQQAGAKHGVAPALLEAVAKHESGFDPRAVSPAGAQGLMQLMPGTAQGLGVNAFDPVQAVDGAAQLLAGHLRKFGSVDLALAAYNAGPGAVQRHGGVPPYKETQNYVRRILTDLQEVS